MSFELRSQLLIFETSIKCNEISFPPDQGDYVT